MGLITYVKERWACYQLDHHARNDYPQSRGEGDENAVHGSNTREELDSGGDE